MFCTAFQACQIHIQKFRHEPAERSTIFLNLTQLATSYPEDVFMVFAIKPIRHEDLDRIYPEGEDDLISKFIYAKREWPQDMHHARWIVDDQANVFLLWLPLTREDSGMRYLFGTPGGVALIRKERYCLYSFIYISQGLISRTEEVKAMIRDIFKMAGEFIDGKADVDDTFSVPNAQFIAD
jgi:hypothetical protein